MKASQHRLHFLHMKFRSKMDRRIKLVFFSLLVLKAIVSIQAAEISYENDVTKHMDSWISKIMKINSASSKKLFSRITQNKIQNYVYDMDREIDRLGKKLHFRDVYMNVTEYKSPQINWKFSENKMGLFIKEFTIRMMGTILETSNSIFSRFDTCLDLENVTFTLSITEDEKTSFEFTQDKSWLWFTDDMKIYWKQESYSGENDEVTLSQKQELEKVFLLALPVLLRENFDTNDEFAKSIRTVFKAYSGPRKTLISTHHDFFSNKENKYYYLIPKIPFFCFNLKNVFIRGLWNLEWLKINTGISIFTHSLMIRNVQGSLILDFGTPQEKPVELRFKIDYFSISTDSKSVNVDARCFIVNKTDTPLAYRQSALIMQRIESAVANSLVPSLQNRRTYEIDTPVEQIKITDKTDWKTIRSSFHEWIPFNDDVIKSAPGGGPPPQVKT